MTGITSRINARAKSASPLAPALLCLFLLFSQSADLVHNHDGSLLRQFDCDICLKIGSSDDALAAAEPAQQFASGAVAYLFSTRESRPSLILAARPRAPPYL